MVKPSMEDAFPGLRGQSYQIKSPKDGTAITASPLLLEMSATGSGRTRPGRTVGPQAWHG